MNPRSTEISKSKALPSIISRAPKKNSDMNDVKSQKSKKDSFNKYSTLKKNDSPLSPLKSVPGMPNKKNNELDNCTGYNEVTCNNVDNSDEIRTGNEFLMRSESFSKYKPLPAINNEFESRNKSSNKRTFETWSSQEKCTELSDRENDDFLLDTIKKMKLGTEECSDLSYAQNKKNPFQKVRSKEKTNPGNIASTSSMNLIIRLPDGERVKHSFSSSDTLRSVVEYLSKIMDKKLELRNYVIYTNEVPKRELKDIKSTLVALGVQNKSVLALDTRDLPDH